MRTIGPPGECAPRTTGGVEAGWAQIAPATPVAGHRIGSAFLDSIIDDFR